MLPPDETVRLLRQREDDRWRRQAAGHWALALLAGTLIPAVAAQITALLVQPLFAPRLMIGPSLIGLIATVVVMRAQLSVIFGLPLFAVLCLVLGAAGARIPVLHDGIAALIAIGPLAGFTIAGTAIIVSALADR